jgi:hypothetical protein
MTFPMALPCEPRDLFRFRPLEGLVYDGLVAGADRIGLWRYPAKASGDLETMRFLDKVYWLYKSGHPVRRARRGSGLEEHFEKQRSHAWTLPEGFVPEREASVSAVGDLMSHAWLAGSSGTLYRDIDDLVFGSDVAMANLECVVLPAADRPLEFDTRSGPPLHFDPRSFDVVSGTASHRFSLMATACNHSLDFGTDGVRSTIEALRARSIAFHGLNETEANEREMSILDANGIRLGIVSFTFGLNARRPPANRPWLVNRTNLNDPAREVDLTLLEEQLAHGRREGVDFVIAQLHWGMEYEHYPRPAQLELAHRLAELGVDAIVGHHPHALQPAEWYRTHRDPARVVPVFYSLGNLTNPFSAPYLCRSGVARIDLARGTNPDSTACTYVKAASLTEVEQVANPATATLSLRPV